MDVGSRRYNQSDSDSQKSFDLSVDDVARRLIPCTMDMYTCTRNVK